MRYDLCLSRRDEIYYNWIVLPTITPKLMWLIQPIHIQYKVGSTTCYVDKASIYSSKDPTFDDMGKAAVYILKKQKCYDEAIRTLQEGV